MGCRGGHILRREAEKKRKNLYIYNPNLKCLIDKYTYSSIDCEKKKKKKKKRKRKYILNGAAQF